MSALLRRLGLVAIVGSGGAGAAIAQAPEKKPDAPATAPASVPAPKGDPLGDLDDLLGLPKAGAVKPAGDGAPLPEGEAAPDRDTLELERRLTAQEVTDRFRKAVEQMGESADRLAKARDAGLVTQRLQEEILKNLDILIKEAESDSSSSSSSSSSSPGQSKGKPNQPAQPRAQGEQSQAGQGENQGEANPPPFEAGPLAGRLDLRTAAWGSLPQRVRDALLQGSGDSFSSLYKSLTEEYYRKLAEEAPER
ncbi:MAG TPA: hypothetical protein DEB06_05295 [Phycisphaerales bacterium]|nr:hypothetical protein [Phycisphaerales bacterium]